MKSPEMHWPHVQNHSSIANTRAEKQEMSVSPSDMRALQFYFSSSPLTTTPNCIFKLDQGFIKILTNQQRFLQTTHLK